jgi:hypothetical protein
MFKNELNITTLICFLLFYSILQNMAKTSLFIGYFYTPTNKGVNPSQKVRGTDSKLGRSGGMLPEFFLNFGTLKRHFQRFEGTYKVIVQCA